jgi:hypothetical protein
VNGYRPRSRGDLAPILLTRGCAPFIAPLSHAMSGWTRHDLFWRRSTRTRSRRFRGDLWRSGCSCSRGTLPGAGRGLAPPDCGGCIGLLDYWTTGLLDYWTTGLLRKGPTRHGCCGRSSGLAELIAVTLELAGGRLLERLEDWESRMAGGSFTRRWTCSGMRTYA